MSIIEAHWSLMVCAHCNWQSCSLGNLLSQESHVGQRRTRIDFVTGSEFDASYGRGSPLTFVVGKGQVIKGWDQGLLDMCPGEKRKLTIQVRKTMYWL
jgi:FK506-binding protein 2